MSAGFNLPLGDTLAAYSASGAARFHMPGHKGRAGYDMPAAYDVTELECAAAPTDYVYRADPGGALGSLQWRAAALWGAEHTFISAGGATLCILAALSACAMLCRAKYRLGPRERVYVLCHRQCHVSAINAMALCGAEPVWLRPERFGGDAGAAVARLLAENREMPVCAVFMTSPDYYGRMQDIAGCARAIGADGRSRNGSLPLVVDNAHGSHLRFHGDSALHPLACGADLCVDSTHKTLPCPTGGALLHVSHGFAQASGIDREYIDRHFRLYASTSPSFYTFCGIERMLALLEADGARRHAELLDLIKAVRAELPAECFFAADDPYRLVLDARAFGLDGRGLYDALAERGAVCEFFDRRRVILIPSIENSKADFERLTAALTGIHTQPGGDVPAGEPADEYYSGEPERCYTLKECARLPARVLPLAGALGRVAAEPLYVYPPGVPIVVSGERIDEEMHRWLVRNLGGERTVAVVED